MEQEQEITQPKLLPSATEILKEAWEIYKSNLGKFIYLAIIPFIILLPSVFLGRTYPGFFGTNFIQSPSITIPFGLGFAVLGIVAQMLFLLALVFIVSQRQLEISPKEALKYAWDKLASYIWISALVSIFVGIGLILFIVPGLVMAIWYSLAIYILVAEDKRGRAALSRSKELVKGHWWGVLWRLIIIGIITAIPAMPFSGLASYAQKTNLIGLEIISGILALAISFLFQGLSVSFSFLLYEKLKGMKE